MVWPVRLCTGIHWKIKKLSSLDDFDRPVSGNDSKTRLFTELYCWLYWTRRFIRGYRHDTDRHKHITDCMLIFRFLHDYSYDHCVSQKHFSWINLEVVLAAVSHLVRRGWLQVWICPVPETRPVWLGFMKQRDVVRRRRLETVAHIFASPVRSCPTLKTRSLLLKLSSVANVSCLSNVPESIYFKAQLPTAKDTIYMIIKLLHKRWSRCPR